MQPSEAPNCWGKQFDDEDDECKNCQYNVSCKPATINNAARRNIPVPSSYQLPVLQQPMSPPRFGSPPIPQPMTMTQPALPNSYYPRAPSTPSMPVAHPVQGPVGYQPHAPPGWNVPIAYLPRPNPANPAWWQYQNETTGSRLGKNILLTALQAIFSELLRFFANWTWPATIGT
jgi:hypothetical protein